MGALFWFNKEIAMAQQLPAAFDKIDASEIQLPIRLTQNPHMTGGQYVSVRPAGEGQRTYLGIYLGELPTALQAGIQGDTLIFAHARSNPVIFVPEMQQFLYGMESWWGEIKSPEELREITNKDINNVWYVQALKTLFPEAKVPGSETVN